METIRAYVVDGDGYLLSAVFITSEQLQARTDCWLVAPPKQSVTHRARIIDGVWHLEEREPQS